MNQNVLTLLPAKARRAIYIFYGCCGLLGVGALAAYGALPGTPVPHWLTAGLAVLGSLTPAISVLAASNTSDAKQPPTA